VVGTVMAMAARSRRHRRRSRWYAQGGGFRVCVFFLFLSLNDNKHALRYNMAVKYARAPARPAGHLLAIEVLPSVGGNLQRMLLPAR